RKLIVSIAPDGNLALFPVDSDIIRKAIDVYHAYYRILLILVGMIFFCRVVYYQFSFAPAEKYADLLRDVFVCSFLMIAFPHVYTYLAECSDTLSQKMSQILHVTGPEIPEMIKFSKSNWPWWLRPEVLPLILYAVAHVVFNLILSILIALGPIVIFAGTMLNFTISITAYFALLLFVWLWPVFWSVLGYFKGLLWAGKAFSAVGVGSFLASVVMFIFQLLSPLAVYSMVRGTHAGQVATGAKNFVKNHVKSRMNAARAAGAAVGGPAGAAVGAKAAGGSAAMQAAGAKSAMSQAGGRVGLVTKLHHAKQNSFRKKQGFLLGPEQFSHVNGALKP
ncbi:MAG: hypothetical protein AABZ06_08250, partial [Bdellovibrionota bacterium]